MIYIKYIWKDDPTEWTIWAHKKGSKINTHILDSDGDTYPYQEELNLAADKQYFKIKYLTPKEIDLLKLELL